MKFLQKHIAILSFLLFANIGFSQTSCAVHNIYTHGVDLTPEVAAKMTRIELIKLEKYIVLDQFDMQSALEGKESFGDCYGKQCLIDLGMALDVEYILSGSIDALGNKIIISLKMIHVNTKSLAMTHSLEFDNQPNEISRMVEITLKEMLGLDVNLETKKSLGFQEEVIIAEQVGRINNSGPRFGIAAAAFGDINEYFQRETYNGGLNIYPIVSNIGYQFEAQYIGTENFSALFEFIPNIGGLEQGKIIPSISILNGFRFGQAGWEVAFGPAFGLRTERSGIFVGDDFYSEQQHYDLVYEEWSSDPNNVDTLTGWWQPGAVFEAPNSEVYSQVLHRNGSVKFNTSFVMAFGRTFRAGALNIPVNIYTSWNKYGGMIGTSFGFNAVKSKKRVNKN
jgi:hypothetical protein